MKKERYKEKRTVNRIGYNLDNALILQYRRYNDYVNSLKVLILFQTNSYNFTAEGEPYFLLANSIWAKFCEIDIKTVQRHISRAKKLGHLKVLKRDFPIGYTNSRFQYNFYQCNVQLCDDFIMSMTRKSFLTEDLFTLHTKFIDFLYQEKIDKAINAAPKKLQKALKQTLTEKQVKRIEALKEERLFKEEYSDVIADLAKRGFYKSIDVYIRTLGVKPNDFEIRAAPVLGTDVFDIFTVNASSLRAQYAVEHAKLLTDEDLYLKLFLKSGFYLDDYEYLQTDFIRVCLFIYSRQASLKPRQKASLNKLSRYKDDVMNAITDALYEVLNTKRFFAKYAMLYEILIFREMVTQFDCNTCNHLDTFYFKKDTITKKEFDATYNKAIKKVLL